MMKRISRVLLGIVLCWIPLMAWVFSAQAQAPISTPSPTPTAFVTPAGSQTGANPNSVSFSQLVNNEIQLTGPYDATTFSFGLPADWTVTPGGQLDLLLNVSFNTTANATAQGQSNNLGAAYAYGGTLSIYMNNVLLAVLQLNQVGELERQIPIPLAAFTSKRSDGLMQVNFILDSTRSCLYYNQQMILIIHETSQFTLPHDLKRPDTNLVNFPQPIYQNSFLPDSVLLVLPDQPSASELQAGMTVATGLSNLSYARVAQDMTTLSQLNPEQRATSDLIFVGKAASLPVLAQLSLPLPPHDDQFQVVGGEPDDGVIELVNSPWSDANVVLVVSGNTDAGTIKAAQAISTGILRPNSVPNLAIVQDVQASSSATTAPPVDQTLESLGDSGKVFSNRGVDSISYSFTIPPGWTVGPDAYFDLVFGNSALLNYDRSSIVVLLNRQPIGSVRMSDSTAKQSTNHIQIDIPASAIVPGSNRLDINVNLVPYDECNPPNVQGLWVNIWPESRFHLPLSLVSAISSVNRDLANYPAPFIYDPGLSMTALVLPHNDLTSWRGALQIAAILAGRGGATITMPSVFYDDAVPQAGRGNYNFIVIGRPSQMSLMTDMNSYLPVPFLLSNDSTAKSDFLVTYRIPLSSPMGYIEMLPSPWNDANTALTILGNTPQGLSWAMQALMDSDLRSQLAGNFAVVNNRQILRANTSLSSSGANVPPTVMPNLVPSPVNSVTSLPPSQDTSWILPVFSISIVLIVLVLAVVIVGGWTRNRARKHPHSEDRHMNIDNKNIREK